MSTLFATKPLDRILKDAEGVGETTTLHRTLSATSLVALGIGAIIGAGLFSLTGIAAANHAGPAVTLSFALAAIGCAFAGLCYSEFSTMIPIAGSAYTYSYATMGELLAWIIGWDLVLEYAVGASTVAVSWSRYLVSLLHDLGIEFPVRWANSPFVELKAPDGSVVHGIVNLPAILVVVGISTLFRHPGIGESKRGDCLFKGRRCDSFYSLRMVLHQLGELHSLYPDEYRGKRSFWIQRGLASGRRCLLCIHRIRCRIHGGAGSEEPETRHADRHHRFAAGLHDTLCAVRPCADRHRQLQGT
jgi:hypothetical protein